MENSTPMMKQYLRLKAENADAILFFHLGDFYEAFFDDAVVLSRELDVVLTARNENPMAGIPIRRGEAYMNKLLKRGYKVAICRQMEDPSKSSGLVRREVVRVMTPGTTIDEGTLDADQNNYLCALQSGQDHHGLATLDLSTGEFKCTDSSNLEELIDEIGRLSPSECLLPQDTPDNVRQALPSLLVTPLPQEAFQASLVPGDSLGLSEEGLQAAGGILSYVKQTQRQAIHHIRPLRPYSLREHMDLDSFTVSSLELVKPIREGQEKGTLLHVLDRTVTSMGRRRLRRALLSPLTDQAKIESRLDAVEALANDDMLTDELQELVKEVHDLERLIGKLGTGRMSPLDLLALQKTLTQVPRIAQKLSTSSSKSHALSTIRHALESDRLIPLCKEFGYMLVEEPPVDARDGGVIRDGYNDQLDNLRKEERSVRGEIASMEATERQRTGIPSLKVGYNRVFGYFIEITKTHLAKVPPEYRRRQTLANAERFITDQLTAYEEQLSVAKDRALALELELFNRALKRLIDEIPLLQSIAQSLSRLDFFLSLASVARHNAYVRPLFTEKHKIAIHRGRHPVVEHVEEFVPNDLILEQGTDQVILTGPNMAGKSVYLRQNALIVLMAQIGSFVPAKKATLPIVDRIFARVGASDILVSGISTFMMEMLEVATILKRATRKSFIILDEMGRGTNTFDGVSIAWAVARELATQVKAKSLFATHYQELTRLADEVPTIINYHVTVKELGKDIIFLHRVEQGIAQGSYGIHVARLAGLPDRVTTTADHILTELLEEAPLSRLGRSDPRAQQIPLFDTQDHPVLKALHKTDVNSLTPLEALQLIAQLKDQL
jgi:DNA mismatch repair protein MutS